MLQIYYHGLLSQQLTRAPQLCLPLYQRSAQKYITFLKLTKEGSPSPKTIQYYKIDII